MNVFCFVLSALVLAGFIGTLAAAEDTKPGKVAISFFAIGALILSAYVFVDGIGVIFGGL